MTIITKQLIGPLRFGFVAAVCVCVSAAMATRADAQPGATPPGSVPPYSPPPPSSAPPSAPGPSPYYGPNYGPQQPQPFAPPPTKKIRQGWNIGLSLGAGSMESSAGDFNCDGCDSVPPAVAFDLHVGSMILPRLALQAEVWAMTRALDANGDGSINQRMLLLAAQYWLTPRFWIKGGFGFAGLSLSYYNGFENVDEPLDDGSALMGAIGYEVMSSSSFALDLQLKTGTGIYDARSEEVSAGVIALGINWY